MVFVDRELPDPPFEWKMLSSVLLFVISSPIIFFSASIHVK